MVDLRLDTEGSPIGPPLPIHARISGIVLPSYQLLADEPRLRGSKLAAGSDRGNY